MTNYPGGLVVVEGLDGSGLTTQAGLLREFLEKKGEEVLLTKEPTEGPNASEVAPRIQRILDGKEDASPKELQRLFVEDRRQHLEEVIKPALAEGRIVINDRYFFSTLAYGAAGEVDLDWLISLNEDFLEPDLTILLKVPPETCVERIEDRGEDVTIFEEKKKLEEIWEGYEKVKDIFTDRGFNIKVIDGEPTPEEVASEIQDVVEDELDI